MQTFCTIITADYFPKAVVLYQSLRKLDADVTLQVLVADNKSIDYPLEKLSGISIITTKDLASLPLVDELYRKYAHIKSDYFRWALKPLLIIHLLKNGFEKVIYADCDLYFVSDFQFLFDYLEHKIMLLTPHWKNSNPLKDEVHFLSTFNYGVFNAGFIGANKYALPALNWWAEACHYKMGELTEIGIFDDQKYLDALPTFFEDVQIVHHRGCNVAPWNDAECKRILVNGEVLINGKYPIVFFHFNHMLVTEILKGHEQLLRRYFDAYNALYEDAGFTLSTFLKDIGSYTNASVIKRIKWRFKIRTRIKRFFYKIANEI